MADGIQMKYDDMDRVSGELTSIVAEIVSNKGEMINKVEYLCETWNSAASQRHREEFESVGRNVDKLTDMAEELINSIKQYRADMEALDTSYS